MDFGTVLNSDWAEATETLHGEKGGNSDWETGQKWGWGHRNKEAENA